MGRRTLLAVATALALSGAGAVGCADEDMPARAATTTPVAEAGSGFPEGEVTKSGAYRVRLRDRAEAERLCARMRDDGWPDVYANHDEVRFALPGRDLVCVPY